MMEDRSRFIGLWESSDYLCRFDSVPIKFRIERGDQPDDLVWDLATSIGLSYSLSLKGYLLEDTVQFPRQNLDRIYGGKIWSEEEGLLNYELYLVDFWTSVDTCKGTANRN